MSLHVVVGGGVVLRGIDRLQRIADGTMASIKGIVRLIVPAGSAKPSPAIGQALGPLGVNMMEFCKVSVRHASRPRELASCQLHWPGNKVALARGPTYRNEWNFRGAASACLRDSSRILYCFSAALYAADFWSTQGKATLSSRKKPKKWTSRGKYLNEGWLTDENALVSSVINFGGVLENMAVFYARILCFPLGLDDSFSDEQLWVSW